MKVIAGGKAREPKRPKRHPRFASQHESDPVRVAPRRTGATLTGSEFFSRLSGGATPPPLAGARDCGALPPAIIFIPFGDSQTGFALIVSSRKSPARRRARRCARERGARAWRRGLRRGRARG